MKKTMSYFWKIGLLFLAVGVVVSVIAVVFGGASEWRQEIWSEAEREMPVQTYEEIRELEMDIKAGHVVIETGETFSVRGMMGGFTEITQEEKDGKLTIREEGFGGRKQEFGWLNRVLKSGHISDDMGAEVIITLPEDAALQKVDIALEAGEVRLGSLTVTEGLKLKIGAGYAELQDYTGTGQLSMDCGAGYILLNGSFHGKADLQCGAGEIEMHLTDGLEEDTNYRIECGIGEVRVGDTTYSNLSTQVKVIRPNAKDELDIECGIGEVAVWFEGNYVY